MGKQWQVQKKKDPYYKRAKGENYRSRASFKLLQLNKKYKIIKKGNNVVDLGAVPGGWSQVALEKVEEEGMVLGIDLQKIKPFPEENFHFIKGDFTKEETQRKIIDIMGGTVDAIISDASPSLSGIKDVDHLRSIDLAESTIDICDNILEENGNLIMKVFQGNEFKNLLEKMKKRFKILKTTKPSSSRKRSSEMYVIGLKYVNLTEK
ncbi:ribosomal RNA large subunit methyltransferase E [Methanobrevibacter cuticularis]|uniref:Ribosomal RNA large subunit methyltransferase E n=1 Tax=Methanobrevibacter cuticularis TaxID=47311 RepID=A0A166CZH6_9EURY|nr:SAM-dependent methyltransferase [Methanobrevibacter cuticularis]KZX15036.1 ribosomal RNA large subunit methyltransferase E [Methanobrevibacter cuticularis]